MRNYSFVEGYSGSRLYFSVASEGRHIVRKMEEFKTIHDSFYIKLLSFILVFSVVSIKANVLVPLSKEGDISYGNFMDSKKGKALQKSGTLLLQTKVSGGEIACASLCVNHNLCLSANVEVNISAGEVGRCELLSWGGNDYLDHLVPKQGFVHIRMEVMKNFSFIIIFTNTLVILSSSTFACIY